MILAMSATLLGIIVYLPLFADTGFSIETYFNPNIIISFIIFMPVIFVIFYFSIGAES